MKLDDGTVYLAQTKSGTLLRVSQQAGGQIAGPRGVAKAGNATADGEASAA